VATDPQTVVVATSTAATTQRPDAVRFGVNIAPAANTRAAAGGFPDASKLASEIRHIDHVVDVAWKSGPGVYPHVAY
jgi:hypothetical protein